MSVPRFLKRGKRESARLLTAGVVLSLTFAATVALGEGKGDPPAPTALKQLVYEAQSLLLKRKFDASLARYDAASRAVARMTQPGPRLYYRALVELGMSASLGGLRRYQDALPHADTALAAIGDPQNAAAPATLKALVHHTRGAILYALGRRDEARAMFNLAAREGDTDAAGWLRHIASVSPPAATGPPPANAGGFPVGVGQSFRDCADCPEMVVIPPGKFMMGSSPAETSRERVSDQDAKREQPLHEVRVGQPLAVGKFHVTRGEFARFVEATGYSAIGGCRALNGSKFEQDGAKSWRDPGFTQTDRDPAVCINWDDAKAYVQWLAQKTGKGYRLLSEAEWEYAARGGTATARWWGDGSADQCKYAHGSNLTSKQKFPGWTTADCGDGYVFTSPVGSFAPNPFGLYDMLGNAWQWVGDCWADNYANAANDASVAPASGGNCGRRAIRGGSWSAIPTVMRVPVRSWNDAGFRSCNLGFRIARTPAT